VSSLKFYYCDCSIDIGRHTSTSIWRVFSVKIRTLSHNFDEVGQKLYEVSQLLYEVGQLLDEVDPLFYEVGQLLDEVVPLFYDLIK